MCFLFLLICMLNQLYIVLHPMLEMETQSAEYNNPECAVAEVPIKTL